MTGLDDGGEQPLLGGIVGHVFGVPLDAQAEAAARILDGLEGSGQSGFDRVEVDRLLAGLAPRRFLLHSVHGAPLVFETRWTMSYLRGPLTRPQLAALTAERRQAGSVPATQRVRGRNPRLHADVALPGRQQRGVDRHCGTGSFHGAEAGLRIRVVGLGLGLLFQAL